jgi:hypothetical protein
VKSSKAEIVSRVHTLPEVSFEDHRLTSFSGLVLFIALFKRLQLMAGLRRCFHAVDRDRVFGLSRVVLQLVIHVVLGFRRLRDRDYYADDPLIQRALGVRKIPDVSTMTRTLAAATEVQVTRFREYVRDLTLDRVETEKLARVTADFDGSVLSTKGHVEGTAVGFNPKRKGARSYYPLFCVLSQLGMFLDMLHRSGNVHDSNGSVDFIRSCITALRLRMPRAVIESRLDSAFFNENVLDLLEELGASTLAKKDPPVLAKRDPPSSEQTRARPAHRPQKSRPIFPVGSDRVQRPYGRCPASARAGSADDGSSRTREPAPASVCAARPRVSKSDTDARARSGGARTRRRRSPSDCARGCESRWHRRRPRCWPDFGSTWCET